MRVWVFSLMFFFGAAGEASAGKRGVRQLAQDEIAGQRQMRVRQRFRTHYTLAPGERSIEFTMHSFWERRTGKPPERIIAYDGLDAKELPGKITAMRFATDERTLEVVETHGFDKAGQGLVLQAVADSDLFTAADRDEVFAALIRSAHDEQIDLRHGALTIRSVVCKACGFEIVRSIPPGWEYVSPRGLVWPLFAIANQTPGDGA